MQRVDERTSQMAHLFLGKALVPALEAQDVGDNVIAPVQRQNERPACFRGRNEGSPRGLFRLRRTYLRCPRSSAPWDWARICLPAGRRDTERKPELRTPAPCRHRPALEPAPYATPRLTSRTLREFVQTSFSPPEMPIERHGCSPHRIPNLVEWFTIVHFEGA